MSSRLVAALAAVILVAATSLDIGAVRADVIPIHRGLPNDGYGEPDSGGGIRSLPIFFSIVVPTGQTVLVGPLWTNWLPVTHAARSRGLRAIRQRTKL